MRLSIRGHIALHPARLSAVYLRFTHHLHNVKRLAEASRRLYVFILQQVASKITHKTSSQKDSKAQRHLQLPATKMSRTNISDNSQYDRK